MTDDPGGMKPLIDAMVGGTITILFLLIPLAIIAGERGPYLYNVNVHHLQ